MESSAKKRVLIVDDSRTIGLFLTKALSSDPHLEVVGHALDAFEARDMIKALDPDVITLDVEMPRMDGVTFLRNLMRLHPMPVVMLSSLTDAGAQITLDALEAGAVDFMLKQQPGGREELKDYVLEINKRVREAANARTFKRRASQVGASNVIGHAAGDTEEVLPELSTQIRKLRTGASPGNGLKRLLAIGASTGGPDALRNVLTTFEQTECALVLAQHMPERFMGPFAERLNTFSRFTIVLAEDGQRIQPGHGYVAPGDQHLEVARRGDALFCKLTRAEPVSGHRPSVDVLFDSVARAASNGALGVLLTGMGEDGARGLLAMRNQGALTLAQDEKSSAVWGMPGKAVALQAADAVVPLAQIARSLNALLKKVG